MVDVPMVIVQPGKGLEVNEPIIDLIAVFIGPVPFAAGIVDPPKRICTPVSLFNAVPVDVALQYILCIADKQYQEAVKVKLFDVNIKPFGVGSPAAITLEAIPVGIGDNVKSLSLFTFA